jgi:hypothetical protein
METSGTQMPEDRQCPKCHTALWFIRPLGNFVTARILSRTSSELESGDFTLVILLSAMAIECEMSRLFIKWKGIDLMRTTSAGMPNQKDEEKWEEEWRKLSRVGKRLDEMSKLLTGRTLTRLSLTNTPLSAASVHQRIAYSKSFSTNATKSPIMVK